jgi:uncharacterized protein
MANFNFSRAVTGQVPLILALIIIGAMLFTWQPWEAGAAADQRTITVTGEAEITAEPDEYVFNPQYEYKDLDREAALKASTDNTNEIVAKLKDLGVPSSKIKTDSNGYKEWYRETGSTYYSYLTIKIDDKKLAQKVQDYLLTTSPYGSVTPSAGFSKSKLKEVTNKARDEATKDARAKADQSAKNLGFSVGKVKTVKDDGNGEGVYPMLLRGSADASMAAGSPELSAPIQAGENELDYQVTVTYYVD